MECMKCGRETSGNDVFCAECLKIMDEHPVNSGIPVQIHPRPEAKRKSPMAKQPKAEETIQKLKKTVSRLKVLCLILTLLLFFTAAALGFSIWHSDDDFNLGFNYSTANSETGGNP